MALHCIWVCTVQAGFYTSCDIHYFVQVVFQGADSGLTLSISISANHWTTEAFSITTAEVVLCKHPSNYSLNRLSYSLNHLTFSLNRLSGSANNLSHSLNHFSHSLNPLSHSLNHLSCSSNYLSHGLNPFSCWLRLFSLWHGCALYFSNSHLILLLGITGVT